MLVSSRRGRGFSLIEMMIAIVILAIVTSLALPSYRAWIQNTRTRTAAESIQNGLQVARAEAVKRNASVQFAMGVNSAWTVGCVTVTADCPAVIQSRAASEGSSADINVVVTPAGNTAVVFNSFGTVSAAPAPFTQIDVSSAVLSVADSRNLRVTLGMGGNARMCDPATSLSASDPRKC